MSPDPAVLAADFFEQTWSAIIDSQPPAVRAHLAAERALVARLLTDGVPGAGAAGRYGTVIEAGCADGSLLLPTVLAAGLDYLGVDLAHGAVRAARARLAGLPRRPDQHAEVVHGDIRDLARLLPPGWGSGARLVAFPFNVFGDIPEPWHALSAAAGTGCAVLVLTYTGTATATRVRDGYYQAAGFAGTWATDSTGTHFTSGLFSSSVYRPPVLRRWLVDAGYTVHRLEYGTIGAAYLGTLPAAEPPRG